MFPTIPSMLKNRKFCFLPAEKITFLYMLLSSVLVLILKADLRASVVFLEFRIIVLLAICLLAFIDSVKRIWMLQFLRYVFLAILLSYWYPETFDINKTLPNLDFWLANFEQRICGCQPALLFDLYVPQHWFSELMNMGYLAYYPLIVFAGFYFYIEDSRYFKIYFFSVIFSFYLYYLLYSIFPTVGPQYYYIANGMSDVKSGIFHQVGTYFMNNHTLIYHPEIRGFFSNMVQATQMAGERPTAAFPSSHVGISTIIMIHIFKKRYFKVLTFITPIYVALLASTVYIKAHYLIDVFAGLLSAVLFYYLSVWIYRHLFENKQESKLSRAKAQSR